METSKYVLIIVASCILSYLLGSISIARFITSKEKKDISKQGSGNPGTMNMLRTHGIGMGLFTLLCDALKGVIPALFGRLYFGEVFDLQFGYMCLYLFGFFAVLGHIFPIFYKFKGGKGIATTFGIFLVVDPTCTLILFGILFVTLYFIKIGSLVSLLFITIDAIVQLFRPVMSANWLAIVFMSLIVIIDIYCHKQNIVRLIENRENPADLQEALEKDVAKIKQKREKKIEKQVGKTERIERKFNKKIEQKQQKVENKIAKLKLQTEIKKDNDTNQNNNIETKNNQN